jgi:hypothetical protein
MIREAIGRAADVSRFIAAGMLALCGARFAATGIAFAVARSAGPVASANAKPNLPPPVISRPAQSAPRPVASKPPVKAGTSLRLPLMVMAEPDRSEVLVDGVNVGNSPFVGEVTCKAGEKIQIEMVPPKGLPRKFERMCVPGATLRIDR